MPIALLITQVPLEAELGQTVLWRHDMERYVAPRLEEARMMALAARPDIVVLDRDLPRAEQVVKAIREEPSTRGTSLVILARDDFNPFEVDLLEAGANAVLRLPAGPEWDERLNRLLAVPLRKSARFPVSLQVDAWPVPSAGGPTPALALNLSANGMLVDSTHPYQPGDDVEVSFHLPGHPEALRCPGRVMRLAASNQYGIEFRGVAPAAAEVLRAFVEGLSPASTTI